MKKFVAITDTHGAHRKLSVIQSARDFATSFKPDLLIHLGDNWDLAALRTGASDAEQATPLKEDFDAAEDTLDVFFGAYVKATKVYLQGNHDHPRAEKLLKHPREMVAGMAQVLLDSMNSVINRFCDHNITYDKRAGVFSYEGMNFLHGYACGIYACKAHAESYDTCMFGHTHAFGVHEMHNHRQDVAFNIACACDVDMDYNRAHRGTLRQKNGFAYGFLDGDKGFKDVHFARELPDGSFFLPTEWNA
jgi:predicted phosphodiesterase